MWLGSSMLGFHPAEKNILHHSDSGEYLNIQHCSRLACDFKIYKEETY